jgi:hypothetical protein
MADLGLFGLMEKVVEMYAIMPRGKKRMAPKQPIMPPQTEAAAASSSPKPKPPKKKKVPVVIEEEPVKKKQTTARAIFDNGYSDPFGNASSAKKPEAKDGGPEVEGEGEGEEGDDSKEEIIYFDVKTGTIGRISRSKCMEKSVIVTQDDQGEEQLDGGVENDEEKEQLIWLLKKGMKQKSGQTSAKKLTMPPKSPPDKAKRKVGATVPKSPAGVKKQTFAKPVTPPGAKKPTVTKTAASSSSSANKATTTTTKPPKVGATIPKSPTGVKKQTFAKPVTPPGAKKPTVTKTAASPPAPKKVGTYEERHQQETERCKVLKLSELKTELRLKGVATNGFCEKSEFVNAVRLVAGIWMEHGWLVSS